MCRGRQVRDGGAYGCAVPRAYANLNPGLLKSLGVTIDTNLRFDCHARNVAKACNFHTRALRHVRSLLTDACSIVASRLDYCNAQETRCRLHSIYSLIDETMTVTLLAACEAIIKRILIDWLKVRSAVAETARWSRAICATAAMLRICQQLASSIAYIQYLERSLFLLLLVRPILDFQARGNGKWVGASEASELPCTARPGRSPMQNKWCILTSPWRGRASWNFYRAMRTHIADCRGKMSVDLSARQSVTRR